MRNLILIITVLLYHALSSHAQVVIKGHVNNYDGKTPVSYTPTIDSIAFGYREVMPKSNGDFNISYKCEGLGTTRLSFANLTYSFIHNGRAVIRLVIDQSKIKIPVKMPNVSRDHVRDSVKQLATISIDGDFAVANRLTNKLLMSSTTTFTVEGCDYSKMIQNAQSPEVALVIMDSLIKMDEAQIRLLQVNVDKESSAENIDNNVINMMLNQVYSYYASAFLNGMMLRRVEQGRELLKNPNADKLVYNSEWEKVVKNTLTEMVKLIKPAANTFEYNQFLLNIIYTISNFQKYDFDPPDLSEDQLIVKQLIGTDLSLLDSMGVVDRNAQLYYKLFNLSRFLNTETFYSPTLLNTYNQIKTEYPNAVQLNDFQPQYEKLLKYIKAASKEYEKAIIIDHNYTTLDDLLYLLRGQNILIDIWATWCSPCIENFRFKGVLDPYLDSGNLTVLYISIDKLSWEKRWRENIKFNKLQGYHVLANELLIEDIWRTLGGPQGRIPRYALVNKNGMVVTKEAPRPRESTELIKQIIQLIKERQ